MKYQRKTYIVEAEPFRLNDGDQYARLGLWANPHFAETDPEKGWINAKVGRYKDDCLPFAVPGDWIVTYEDGSRMIMSEDAFHAMFQPTEGGI